MRKTVSPDICKFVQKMISKNVKEKLTSKQAVKIDFFLLLFKKLNLHCETRMDKLFSLKEEKRKRK